MYMPFKKELEFINKINILGNKSSNGERLFFHILSIVDDSTDFYKESEQNAILDFQFNFLSILNILNKLNIPEKIEEKMDIATFFRSYRNNIFKNDFSVYKDYAKLRNFIIAVLDGEITYKCLDLKIKKDFCERMLMRLLLKYPYETLTFQDFDEFPVQKLVASCIKKDKYKEVFARQLKKLCDKYDKPMQPNTGYYDSLKEIENELMTAAFHLSKLLYEGKAKEANEIINDFNLLFTDIIKKATL